MVAFLDFALRTRIVAGPGSVARVGALANELGVVRAFLVSDPGVAAAGHADRVRSLLVERGIEVRSFEAVCDNPTTADVAACLRAVGDFQLDLFVAVGGGSAMDVAKACNLLRAGGGAVEDYWGSGKARGALAPMIAIPTTAGTGSEVQSFALIAKQATHQKMACGDPGLAPKIAILDAELTVTLPEFVTICTGLDTIGHAVETAVTSGRNAMSLLYSTAALERAAHALPRVLDAPGDLAQRGAMLEAACFAGIAIENSMLGAAHALANPLTAHDDIPHGLAVGLMLPHVVRFNAVDADVEALYDELARSAGIAGSLADALDRLLDRCGLKRSLRAHGVDPAELPDLAREAAAQWTAQFNPRRVDEGLLCTLYRRALGARRPPSRE